MAILLLFCLPLVFFSYVYQLEEKNKHIVLFVVGIAATTLFLLIVSFFSANTDHYIDSLGNYFFYFFSGFYVLTTPAALFGFFTVKIYQQLFLASTHLHIMPIVLYIVMYAGALFILDALLHFSENITFYPFIAYALCFILFIGILMLGTLALGLNYFKGNPLIYNSILTGIVLIGMVLHFIIYRQGNAA